MKLIYPNWQSPSHIKAFSTTRFGDFSIPTFPELDLEAQGDKTKILTNRLFLKESLNLPSDPLWLNQVHGNQIRTDQNNLWDADGAITFKKGTILTVRTADCLPIFLTDLKGTFVSVLHAGWRSLVSGIITEAMKYIPVSASNILVHLGPCISQDSYEVGQEVFDAFVQAGKDFSKGFKRSDAYGKYYLDLKQCARIELQASGITQVTQHEGCTFKEHAAFYSYRREGKTGRMGHFVYFV